MTQENHTPRDNRTHYQQDSVMGHEYDGIQEFDNRLPNWWLWIMWGSMIFALFYWITFHTLKLQPLPQARFEQVMLQAQEDQLARAAKAGITNETLVMMSQVPSKITEGHELFVKHCVACHLDKGQGLVGPNLTDGYWIHGCEPMQMLKVIQTGVAAKGMPAWMNQLGPTRTQSVLAYVLTLRDTNVPGKESQGEPCEFK
ncbi:cytochrome oxidase subunit III [bacterium CG17_big_fil_post_rev_8_21_14_2_50_64_8]|nr:MAG: cytochrome oxidase subunit III [bacterium CG17_big_fil_post_rev_8_21_14_2_50_64_8]PJA76297.1 MAG: cytochrome oxidase subunit III [bacterium CG_4_9_14_3_um_filter_65_15]